LAEPTAAAKVTLLPGEHGCVRATESWALHLCTLAARLCF
jgi:hypothetical protein